MLAGDIDFIVRNLAGGSAEQCAARLVATGIVQQFNEFVIAETTRNTRPVDLLTAVSSVQAGILTVTMSLCLKRESRLAAADLYLDLFVKQIRSGMIDDGAKK